MIKIKPLDAIAASLIIKHGFLNLLEALNLMKIADLNVDELITTMGNELINRINSHNLKEVKVIGIKTGGVWIADKICKILGIPERPGQLNIAYYRDDFDKIDFIRKSNLLN